MGKYDGVARGHGVRMAVPKSVVLKIVNGAVKKFDKTEGKPMWFYGEQKFGSIQELVDALFTLYPALKPYATVAAIQRVRAAAEQPIVEDDCETTPLYWDCECDEDYIHLKSDDICARCNARAEDQPDSRISEVLAAGMALKEVQSEQD